MSRRGAVAGRDFPFVRCVFDLIAFDCEDFVSCVLDCSSDLSEADVLVAFDLCHLSLVICFCTDDSGNVEKVGFAFRLAVSADQPISSDSVVHDLLASLFHVIRLSSMSVLRCFRE